MKNEKQFYSGVALVIIAIIFATFLAFKENGAELSGRFLIGIGIGYVLSRGFIGFAGGINRAYRAGSTKLMRYLMFLFVITSFMFAATVFANPQYKEALSLNPINLGLILGAFIFGIGAAIASCCASGVLCALRSSTIKYLIVLFFFCMGAFFGFRIQETASWVAEGPVVYFPDLMPEGAVFGGLMFAVLVTIALASFVVWLSYKYEGYAKNKLAKPGYVASELHQDESQYTLFEKLFTRPFTMTEAMLYLAGIISILFIAYENAWGVSSTFGFWFGKFLMLFGFSAEQLGEFTAKGAEYFEPGLFESAGSVQNIGIIFGAFIFVLMAGKFSFSFKIKWRDAVLFGFAGFLLGFGTRLANGCNAGALYLPIASFSLSGWIYLLFMSIGAVFGNKFFRH